MYIVHLNELKYTEVFTAVDNLRLAPFSFLVSLLSV